MQPKLFIEDLDIADKKVLMRVDFNVPLDGEGHILDASRIHACLPSIRYVLDKGGSLILMSHLGRPRATNRLELSLNRVADFLSQELKREVIMANQAIGEEVAVQVDRLKKGDILLLQNLRFYRAEEYPQEDPTFAATLASYGDLYINEAFACSHRRHASIWQVPSHFANRAAAGYQMQKEIDLLTKLLSNPQRPFWALIGGAKVESKIGLLKSLAHRVDGLLIGGAMAFAFLKAKGLANAEVNVGEEVIQAARAIMQVAEQRKIPLLLPSDTVAAAEMTSSATTKIFSLESPLPKPYIGFDIGPKTVAYFSHALEKAKTILWNGPMGVYEMENFAHGTEGVALCIAKVQAMTVVAGGDSVAAIVRQNLEDKISHLSTGGGATLEFIEKGTLPGIEALSDKIFSQR